MRQISTLDEAQKLALGATILGAGGGGDPKEGLKMLREVLEAGQVINLVSLDELKEDTVMVVPYYVGSIAPGLKARKPVKIGEPIKRAFEEMEKILSRRIGAVVTTEIGGANTPVALSIGAKLDIPVIDGDLIGRAAPELHQCTVHIFGIPMYPSVIVTETGDVVIVKEYADIDDYEALARHISVLGGRFSAVVDTPMRLEEARKAVIRGTISLCVELGDRVIKARSQGGDPVEAVVESLNGWRIFEGIVDKYEWRNEGGFLKGVAEVSGRGRFKGRKLKTWIMNEHIMVWLDDKPIVMPPDLMTFLRHNGEPITNTELKVGDEVYVVAAKAPEVWRTEDGLKYFGPRHFGFEYDYAPVEELVERAGYEDTSDKSSGSF